MSDSLPFAANCIRSAAFCVLVSATATLYGQDNSDLPASHSITPELFATGFELPDGPTFDDDGNFYAVNYRHGGTIGRITPDGTASVWCSLDSVAPASERQAQPTGLKVGRFGRMIVADTGAGRLLRLSPGGDTAQLLADRFEGARFTGVKDVALDAGHNIYFTDAGDTSDENARGSVYRYSNSNQLVKIAGDLAGPTGIAVAPDQTQVVVAESRRFRVLSFDVTPAGEVRNKRVLITFPEEDHPPIRGGPHAPGGVTFDAKGRLYVAMGSAGVINVVDIQRGVLIRQYSAGGDTVTNCHFHGEYLYTTVPPKEAVFRIELGVTGFDYRRP